MSTKHDQAILVAEEKGVCTSPQVLKRKNLYELLEREGFIWRKEYGQWATEKFYLATHEDYDPTVAIRCRDQLVVSQETMEWIRFYCDRYQVDVPTFMETMARGDITEAMESAEEMKQRGQTGGRAAMHYLDKLFDYNRAN